MCRYSCRRQTVIQFKEETNRKAQRYCLNINVFGRLKIAFLSSIESSSTLFRACSAIFPCLAQGRNKLWLQLQMNSLIAKRLHQWHTKL